MAVLNKENYKGEKRESIGRINQCNKGGNKEEKKRNQKWNLPRKLKKLQQERGKREKYSKGEKVSESGIDLLQKPMSSMNENALIDSGVPKCVIQDYEQNKLHGRNGNWHGEKVLRSSRLKYKDILLYQWKIPERGS